MGLQTVERPIGIFHYIMQESRTFLCICLAHAAHHQWVKNHGIAVSIPLSLVSLHSNTKTSLHYILTNSIFWR